MSGLGQTRSSANWAGEPGGMDRLNAGALFDGDGTWGIPLLAAAGHEPSRLVAYSDRRACETAGPGDAVHCFLDDYRFEVCWSRPERALSRVRRVGLALTPDFSLWREMPLAMQLWQVYRSRWVGAWWSACGVGVIPTVSWSTPESHAWAFTGIAAGSVVAVSTVGVLRDREARRLFAAGMEALAAQVRPRLALCYGRMPPGLSAGLDVREYPAGRF